LGGSGGGRSEWSLLFRMMKFGKLISTTKSMQPCHARIMASKTVINVLKKRCTGTTCRGSTVFTLTIKTIHSLIHKCDGKHQTSLGPHFSSHVPSTFSFIFPPPTKNTRHVLPDNKRHIPCYTHCTHFPKLACSFSASPHHSDTTTTTLNPTTPPPPPPHQPCPPSATQ
jgi:hypothetical protein